MAKKGKSDFIHNQRVNQSYMNRNGSRIRAINKMNREMQEIIDENNKDLQDSLQDITGSRIRLNNKEDMFKILKESAFKKIEECNSMAEEHKFSQELIDSVKTAYLTMITDFDNLTSLDYLKDIKVEEDDVIDNYYAGIINVLANSKKKYPQVNTTQFKSCLRKADISDETVNLFIIKFFKFITEDTEEKHFVFTSHMIKSILEINAKDPFNDKLIESIKNLK
jgi:hypothetical protein